MCLANTYYLTNNKMYAKAAVIIKGTISSQTPLQEEQRANKAKKREEIRLIIVKAQLFQKEILNIELKYSMSGKLDIDHKK